MQFVGQTHLLRVPLPDARPTRADLAVPLRAAYLARFRVDLPEIRAALVNLALLGHRPPPARRPRPPPRPRRPPPPPSPTPRPATRPVRFADGWHDTPVYRRDRLPAAATLAGPAIIEQMDTTTVLAPGDRASQDADGNLLVTIADA